MKPEIAKVIMNRGRAEVRILLGEQRLSSFHLRLLRENKVSERYHPKEENVYRLKQTILGFCTALKPPRVFLPSQVRNKWFEATEAHERMHAVLIRSSTYGFAEQILTHLIQARCSHIGLDSLEQILDQCIENSFLVHEGCATLSELYVIEAWQLGNKEEFLTELPEDYQHALSQILAVVNLFGFEGYIASWQAMQIAAICLSPPLFGPLLRFHTYQTGLAPAVFADERFSADLRLERIITDGRSGRISKLIENVRSHINDSLARVFPTPKKPNFQDDFLRRRFVRTCEPLVEKCFAEAYPEFYEVFHGKEHTVLQKMTTEFVSQGCSCLEGLSFHSVDLLDEDELIRPVALPDRQSHWGAIALSNLSSLPLQEGDRYYIGLHFCEKPDPEIICSDPLRILHEGHLYVRLQRFRKAEEKLQIEGFYWFIFCSPNQIPDALSELGSIPGIVICPACGEIDRVIARITDCCQYGFRKIFLQIDAITAEGLADLVERLPCEVYNLLLLREEGFGTIAIFLKATPPLFDVVLPVTWHTMSAISARLSAYEKIRMENMHNLVEPDDIICFQHLCALGW